MTSRASFRHAAPAEAQAFRAAHPGIERIDAIIPDSCGVLRGKRIPIDRLNTLYCSGLYLPGSLFASDITGSTVEETGLGFEQGDADRRCWPVAGTLHPKPWQDTPTGQVLLAMEDLDGTPFFANPRTVLMAVLERLAADDLHPVVAAELEFYLIDSERAPAGPPRPPRAPVTGRCQTTTQINGLDELDDFDALLGDIHKACEQQDIPVDSIMSEYAPGQYEINLRHVGDAVLACDHAVLFKRAVKGVAARHGVEATFMAKPYPDRSGSGLHIHLSLCDGSGRNVFADDDPAGSPMLRHAIGGLAATMAEGMALFAQNQNAFRRFQPNAFVPLAPTWGVNNRSAALRIPAGQAADRRVEHRLASADANPYLVMAAVLAGIHYGITHRIDPGPPVVGNAYATVAPVLTSSWAGALDRLERSAVFADYIGQRFLSMYLALKRAERATFFATITPLEYAWYLHKV